MDTEIPNENYSVLCMGNKSMQCIHQAVSCEKSCDAICEFGTSECVRFPMSNGTYALMNPHWTLNIRVMSENDEKNS